MPTLMIPSQQEHHIRKVDLEGPEVQHTLETGRQEESICMYYVSFREIQTVLFHHYNACVWWVHLFDQNLNLKQNKKVLSAENLARQNKHLPTQRWRGEVAQNQTQRESTDSSYPTNTQHFTQCFITRHT